MRNLFSELSQYKAVGFDLDGTLYDEFNFVDQVYKEIGMKFSLLFGIDEETISSIFLNAWIREGNTNRLFQNAIYQLSGLQNGVSLEELLSTAIQTYREIEPVLVLSNRVQTLLEYLITEKKILFLVTDGGENLQNKKIQSLKLSRYIAHEFMIISGAVKKGAKKTDQIVISKCHRMLEDISAERVIYCGDREIDKEFAYLCHFDYQKIIAGNVVDQISYCR